MEKIVWGEAIEVNGKKPEWLGDELINPVWFSNIEEGDYPSGAQWVCCEHTHITHIKLPADHFAYTAIAQGFTPWGGGEGAPEDWDGGTVLWRSGTPVDGENWNWAVGQGCGGPLPSDIIGYRKRAATSEDFLAALPSFAPEVAVMAETATWGPASPDQLIADFYQKFGAVADDTPRHIRILDALADVDETTVVVKRMSEGEWEKLATDWFLAGKGAPIIGYALQVIGKLGIITYPTPIERFAAENPGIVNDENRHWFELALEWGRS